MSGATKIADKSGDLRPKLFVTRCTLAPGAPLNPLVEGTDVLIVGMNNGEVVNEKKTPPSHVNISNGIVMLMPKEEPYLLRNIGKENLELLVIEVRK
jgi:mannose-6-phosphate isomerase-like protein (cupin superfamily)